MAVVLKLKVRNSGLSGNGVFDFNPLTKTPANFCPREFAISPDRLAAIEGRCTPPGRLSLAQQVWNFAS
jgi:hypothetical protein